MQLQVVCVCFQDTAETVQPAELKMLTLWPSGRVLLPAMTEIQVIVTFHVVSLNLWLLTSMAEDVRRG